MSKYVLMSRILRIINTFWKRYRYEDLRLSWEEKRIRRKIRQVRHMKRMSQSAPAAKMQVEGVLLERDSISRIESGERFVADYELQVFAKVLGVDVKWLLNEN